jgi:hypothetical protein
MRLRLLAARSRPLKRAARLSYERRPHRIWLALAVPAALAALVATVPAASSAPAATALHGRGVATAPRASDGVRIVQRGLVHDCEYISNYYEFGLEIAGNGVNEPASLVAAPGNCFNLYNEFTWDGYTGYEYQNGLGHCLWQDDGVIELGAACKANHENEEFFGAKYYSGVGWLVSNRFLGTGSYMYAPGCGTAELDFGLGGQDCEYWNFPQS